MWVGEEGRVVVVGRLYDYSILGEERTTEVGFPKEGKFCCQEMETGDVAILRR